MIDIKKFKKITEQLEVKYFDTKEDIDMCDISLVCLHVYSFTTLMIFPHYENDTFFIALHQTKMNEKTLQPYTKTKKCYLKDFSFSTLIALIETFIEK